MLRRNSNNGKCKLNANKEKGIFSRIPPRPKPQKPHRPSSSSNSNKR